MQTQENRVKAHTQNTTTTIFLRVEFMRKPPPSWGCTATRLVSANPRIESSTTGASFYPALTLEGRRPSPTLSLETSPFSRSTPPNPSQSHTHVISTVSGSNPHRVTTQRVGLRVIFGRSTRTQSGKDMNFHPPNLP